MLVMAANFQLQQQKNPFHVQFIWSLAVSTINQNLVLFQQNCLVYPISLLLHISIT